MCPKKYGRKLILAGVASLALLIAGSGCAAEEPPAAGPAAPAERNRPSPIAGGDEWDEPKPKLPPPVISSAAAGDPAGITRPEKIALPTGATSVAGAPATATSRSTQTPFPAITLTSQASPELPNPPLDQDLEATATVPFTPTLAAGRLAETITLSTTTSLTSTNSLSPASSPEGTLNGLPFEKVIVLSEETREHVRQIFLEGQGLGRNTHAFSRLGASTVATFHFMGRFDAGPYDLGPYAYLQPAIDHFAGSFSWVGLTSARGLTAWGAFDPLWANPEACEPSESPIDCEMRVHNPSILFIALGTNEKWDPVEFDDNLCLVVEYAIENGVIPVLATKADRFDGPDNRNNQIIRRVAADYAVPLLDFDLLSDTLPAKGMTADDVHLTLFDYYDYKMPRAYETGYGMYNLSALMMLNTLLSELVQVEF